MKVKCKQKMRINCGVGLKTVFSRLIEFNVISRIKTENLWCKKFIKVEILNVKKFKLLIANNW